MTTVKACSRCGKANSRRCAGCGAIRYCSEECQNLDWSRHSPMCNGQRYLRKLQESDQTIIELSRELKKCNSRIRYLSDATVTLSNVVKNHDVIFRDLLEPQYANVTVKDFLSAHSEQCQTLFDSRDVLDKFVDNITK